MIDSLISAAETKARELQEAIAALNAATQDAHGFGLANGVVRSVEDACAAIASTRKRIAMASRPKGPVVKMVGSGFGDRSEPGEVVRRTPSIVYVRLESVGKQYQFAVKSGYPTGPKAERCTWNRISPADLDRIRAMPVGENEVSRALKAAEAVK